MFKHTPQEARKLWANELRHGGHIQGRGCLNNQGKLCCLGVACEAMRKAEGEEALEKRELADGTFEYGMNEEFRSGYVPELVREWLGLTARNGSYRGTTDSLANNNDCDRKSFHDIASIIESEPEGLFVKEGA